MALVCFRSRAAPEILMVADVAHRLLAIIGREPAERGVLRGDDLALAIDRLDQAVQADRAQGRDPFDDDGLPAHGRPVSLSQRAFPLLGMMRASLQRKVDVTWGV